MEEVRARITAMPRQNIIVVSIIESMNTSLTLSEVVVMYATLSCLILVCIKGRVCPQAWSTRTENFRLKLRKEEEEEDPSLFASEDVNDG